MEDSSPNPNPIINYFAVIKKAIIKFTDYKGRSTRSDYYYWFLFVVLCSIIVGIIVGLIMELVSVLGEIILSLFLVFIFVVSLPLGFRRLKDTGKNGFLMFLGLIPIVGGIILLVFFCKDSKEDTNNLGELPKQPTPSEEGENERKNLPEDALGPAPVKIV